MESNRTTGRIIGALFLIIIIAGSTSLNLRGLSSSALESESFLNSIFENSTKMKFSILLDLIAVGTWVAIATIMFPILKMRSISLALWFYGFWIVSFAVSVMGNTSHLSLISLSQEFVKAETPNIDYFQTLSVLLIKKYFWAHFLGLITYTVGTSAFFYQLYKTRMIPQFLSLWSLLAITIVFSATWAQIFDYKVSFYLYMQNGLAMISLTTWLLIKGFSSTTESTSPIQVGVN